jgi:hypothetical protein
MSRHLTILLCALSLVAGCSRNPERSSAGTPTSPSAASQPGSLIGPTSVAPGGISGKFDVSFPPRDQSFDFYVQLEAFYTNVLGRGQTQTYVDREGVVVWTQEYIRYRTNGCDHATAVQRVLAQIANQPAGAVCGAPPEGLIQFPPRNETMDFRRTLETTYQLMGRGLSSSSVDAEGSVIWTQEYLRYRVNGCDHATAMQKVFSQIAGGGVAPTCFVAPCMFSVAPTSQSVAAGGGTFTAVVTKDSGENCTFGAESLDSYVTITAGTSGTDTTTVTYTVAANPGGARTGNIRVRWTNNSKLLEINQAAGSGGSGGAAFTMTDPNAGSGATTNCAIRSTATPCVFTAPTGFSSSAVYTWHIEYQYGGGVSHDFSSTSPTFTFTQSCGGPGATVGGNAVALSVTLTVTDGGATTTFQSGSGSQPALTITFFTC